jgi:hypothetical protein
MGASMKVAKAGVAINQPTRMMIQGMTFSNLRLTFAWPPRER